MTKINTIYGRITDGAVPADMPYYRFTNVGRYDMRADKARYLKSLVRDSFDAASRAHAAEVLIGLMQTGEDWVSFKAAVDPLNTYDRPTQDSEEPIRALLNWDAMIQWADSCPITDDCYVVTQADTAVERVVKVLYTILGD